MTGPQAALATEDPLRCPPAGPATDPGFDRAILEPLVRNHDRASRDRGQPGTARAAAPGDQLQDLRHWLAACAGTRLEAWSGWPH